MFFSNLLNKNPHLTHCFFSRKNGVSDGIYKSLNCGLGSKDDKKKIIKNINIISKKLHSKKKTIITLNQIHSNKVIYFKKAEDVKDKILGDAIVTNIKNVGIAILTADCVPILIYDSKKKIIGCIHAGWKGSLKGIVENTIRKFFELNSNASNLVVAIGPCISQKNYEVGKDFYKKFINQKRGNNKFFNTSNNSKYLFDIRSYISEKLIKLGIRNIDHIRMDTFSDAENFFSHRRSKKDNDKDYGRCISVILMT